MNNVLPLSVKTHQPLGKYALVLFILINQFQLKTHLTLYVL